MTATASQLVAMFDAQAADPLVLEDEVILVAIPAYNEERFIGSVVHGVRLEGFECLVIDDGSTDRTSEIAAAAGAIIERHPDNRGKSAALNSAFEVARRLGVGALVVMDGDWQHEPREIHAVLEPVQSGTADIVSGSRFMTNGRTTMPSVRGAGLRAVTFAANVASGQRLTDSQTGFRAFSRHALEVLRFRSAGFAVEVEVGFLARLRGLRHIEVPITTRYVDPPKRNVMGQGLQVVDGLVRLVAHYRPLLFFGVPGAVLVVAGMGVGTVVVDIYGRGRELAAGYALLAVLLISVGAAGLFAGLILHVLRGIFLGLEQQIHVILKAIDSPARPR
jgi:hypothetical protein